MILGYIRNNQFYKLKVSEKYILRNLCFRIKVVNDVLQTLNIKSKNSFFVSLNSSFENLFLTFNLRELFSLKSVRYRHYSKNFGSILSFSYPFGYYLFNFALWNSFLLPINEFSSDRLSFGFRPYRSSYDCFLVIKKSLSSDSYNNFFVKLKFSSIFNLISLNWLLNNCPINKSVLKSWFLNNDTFLLSFDSHNLLSFCQTDLFFSLVNFIFNGLLRFI